MKKPRKPAKPVSADVIARLADRSKDVSGFFKGHAAWSSRFALEGESRLRGMDVTIRAGSLTRLA